MGLKAQHITIKCTCLSNSQHCVNNCVEEEDLAASFFIYHNWHHILGCRLCLVYMCCVYTVFLRPGFLLKNMNGLLWSTLSKGLFSLLVFLLSAARVVRHTGVFLQISSILTNPKRRSRSSPDVLENSSSNPERNQCSWVVGCASLMFGSSSIKNFSFTCTPRFGNPGASRPYFWTSLVGNNFTSLELMFQKCSVGG